MKNEFDEMNYEIRRFFSEELISLIIFGSSCRKNDIDITSDIDYIIILESVNNQDIISRKLKEKLVNFLPLVAFNIYSKSSFPQILAHNKWLTLSIKLGYYIIFDKESFFYNNIEYEFKHISHQKIAPNGWKINFKQPHAEMIIQFISLSNSYYECATVAFSNQIFDIANILLMNSIHCYMSGMLCKRNIYITKGEIVQCFIKTYLLWDDIALCHKLLEIEQNFGKIGTISFDYEDDGNVSYLTDKIILEQLFVENINIFQKLKEKLLD